MTRSQALVLDPPNQLTFTGEYVGLCEQRQVLKLYQL